MPPLYQRVFYYLRQQAKWKPEEFPTRQNFKIALNPGQLITSLSLIARGVSWYEYGVERRPNKKTIQNILRWLEGNGKVTVESNEHGTYINITNWTTYNHIENEEVTQKKRKEVTQKKRQVATIKEGEEKRKEKRKGRKGF